MAQRSLNKVQLIGNLTRDPELRYTPQGTPVCTFGLATNRQWTTEKGEKKEETEFHRIVAWNKLAEICSQLLAKGRKVYIEGRLQTRKWTASDGSERQTTEIVANDMMILDSRRVAEESGVEISASPEETPPPEDLEAVLSSSEEGGEQEAEKSAKEKEKKNASEEKKSDDEKVDAENIAEDIPF